MPSSKKNKRFVISPTFVVLALFILFALSRLFIWIYRPVDFTEIIYSYMPYAHLWASGVKPYLEQWFEYPPGTIPLFYVPHAIDMATLNMSWHIDYLHAYRGMMLIIDVLVCFYVWKTLRHTQQHKGMRYLSALYLILVTAKAHHFIYDTIDWAFAGAILVSATAPLTIGKRFGAFASWIGYWIGVAVKLVNGPLGAVYAVFDLKHWKKTAFWIVLSFFLVLGAPVLMFRSSLQVITVYHQQRGLQIDSVGAVITRVVNRFTNSEKIIEVYKNYENSGPVSAATLKIVEFMFPIALVSFVLYSWYLIRKSPKESHDLLRIHLTLGYIIVFTIFSKVLSTPFLLWILPLLAVYPFKSMKEQLGWQLSSLFVIVICMSPLPRIDLRIIHLAIIVHSVKSIIFFVWLWRWIALSRQWIDTTR